MVRRSSQVWALLQRVSTLPILVCEDPGTPSAWFIERDAVLDLLLSCWMEWERAFVVASSTLSALQPLLGLAQQALWNGSTYPALWRLLLAFIAVDDARCGVLPMSELLRVTKQRLGDAWSLDSEQSDELRAFRSLVQAYSRSIDQSEATLSWVRCSYWDANASFRCSFGGGRICDYYLFVHFMWPYRCLVMATGHRH
jgi:hypothetical protein